jgi:hypothetical protein
MKKIFVLTLFMLAALAWAAAQQPGTVPDQSTDQSTTPNPQTSPGETTSPSSQAPGASPSQPSPGGANQAGQTGTITEGCLAGSDPNYTITDKAGTTYKLNIPSNADTSKLASHVGESVQVMGDVKGAGSPASSINVQGIGKGSGKCPTGGSSGTQPPPKK